MAKIVNVLFVNNFCILESLRLRTQLRTLTQDVRKSTSAHARQGITFSTAEFGSRSERRFLNYRTFMPVRFDIMQAKRPFYLSGIFQVEMYSFTILLRFFIRPQIAMAHPSLLETSAQSLSSMQTFVVFSRSNPLLNKNRNIHLLRKASILSNIKAGILKF